MRRCSRTAARSYTDPSRAKYTMIQMATAPWSVSIRLLSREQRGAMDLAVVCYVILLSSQWDVVSQEGCRNIGHR